MSSTDLAVLQNLVKAAGWVGFVLLGLWVVRAERRRQANRPGLTNLLLLYAVAISFAPGLSQRDLWPFSAWTMMADVRSPILGHARALGVDATGREHPIDYRVWQPLQWEELIAWLGIELPNLSPAEQDSALSYLLRRANEGRMDALRGKRPGYLHRFLGPLEAPEHMLHPKLWRRPDQVPPQPFVALRVVWESWNADSGRREPGRVTRRLIHEFPRPE
jgi:hypothetical protein